MKWLLYSGLFLGGAVVGGLIVRELAIERIEDPVNSLVDKVFGANTYASGATKTVVNSFLRN